MSISSSTLLTVFPDYQFHFKGKSAGRYFILYFSDFKLYIDVYRGHTKAQQNIISLATYICMFPQLIEDLLSDMPILNTN